MIIEILDVPAEIIVVHTIATVMIRRFIVPVATAMKITATTVPATATTIILTAITTATHVQAGIIATALLSTIIIRALTAATEAALTEAVAQAAAPEEDVTDLSAGLTRIKLSN